MAAPLATADIVVAEQFVDPQLSRMLYTMLRLRQHRHEGKRDDHMPTALSFWGDSTLDALHLTLLPEVEALAGGRLLSTYCYARLYLHGDVLRRHHDREACEIVLSVHLGHRGARPEPICFASGHVVHQRPGDAVMFPGATVDHWRDEFVGEDFGQIFMNFVRADGPYHTQALDGRFGAFPPSLVPHPAHFAGAGQHA